MKQSRRIKKLKKNIRKTSIEIMSWPIKLILYFVFNMPEVFIRTAAEVSASVFWHVGFYWRKRAMENLRFVYKDKLTEKELKDIAKESMKNIVRVMCELIAIPKLQETAFKNMVVSGEAYLKEALSKGDGVIGLGNHVGNFIYMVVGLTMKGYPISYMFKEPENKQISGFLWDLKKRLNLSPIPLHPRKQAIKKSFIWLKKKNLLWLALDQDARKGDVGVEFFGIKAATPQGPAVLATKTGSVVLPMYVKRKGWLAHEINIWPPIEMVNTSDKEADKYTNLKKMNEITEKMILDNPKEWWWIHRRWKRSYRYETKEGTN
jgi:KDO2-lipid IV(A) lauroyltransferase